MSGSAANQTADKADALRAAIAGDYQRLCAYMAGVIKKNEGRLRFDELRDRVEEVVAEAVGRALKRADAYDPQRSAFPWVMRIACNVHRELIRPTPERRQVKQTDLGEDGWDEALATLIDPGDDQDAMRRCAAIAKVALDEEDRRVIELGVVQGLGGAELARALGAPSAGAARVRLCRAVRALRAAFDGAMARFRHDEEEQQP